MCLRVCCLKIVWVELVRDTRIKLVPLACPSSAVAVVRVTGIGPVSLAWEASILPLYYTRYSYGGWRKQEYYHYTNLADLPLIVHQLADARNMESISGFEPLTYSLPVRRT